MSTIRRDPVTGRQVIIASDRADRPRTFGGDRLDHPEPERCPFCRGNEDATPPAIAAYPNGASDDWRVRVVPNKFPAVSSDDELVESDGGLHGYTNGVGAHEVIVETPNHVVDVTELGVEDFDLVLRSWQDRVRDLGRDRRLETALVFKNHGAPAGASLEHAHSQLVAVPYVPPHLEAELDGSRRHFDRRGSCVFCRLLDEATDDGERVVYSDDRVAVVAPFASRFPFELTVLPRPHCSRFEEASDSTRRGVAEAFLEVVDRLERALDAPPYNAVLHTAPLQAGSLDHYHWHFELIPTLSHIAGFEWGSGSHINPTPPERAAEHLRRLGSEDSDP